MQVVDFRPSFNVFHYFMASSVSGHDEPNPELWLATRAGNMGLLPVGTARYVPQEKNPRKPYNKSFTDKLVQSRWVDIGLLFCEKNLANIQPSWPHTWSITYIYFGAQELTIIHRSGGE